MKSRTFAPQIDLPTHVSAIELALLERLFDQASEIAFFVKDAGGRYVTVNQSLVTRHGLKNKSQVIGNRPIDICPGDFGRIPTEQDERVLNSGKPIIDYLEMQWHLPNDPVWCLTTKLPITDPAGAVVGIIGFSRDIRVSLHQCELPSDFAEALAEFEKNLSPDVTPVSLARRARLSPTRLARLTKRIFDLTPSQLIAKTRIAAASRILLETNHSVAETAHACGFYDHSAFTRAFRLATGVTPKDFRTQWLSASNPHQ